MSHKDKHTWKEEPSQPLINDTINDNELSEDEDSDMQILGNAIGTGNSKPDSNNTGLKNTCSPSDFKPICAAGELPLERQTRYNLCSIHWQTLGQRLQQWPLHCGCL